MRSCREQESGTSPYEGTVIVGLDSTNLSDYKLSTSIPQDVSSSLSDAMKGCIGYRRSIVSRPLNRIAWGYGLPDGGLDTEMSGLRPARSKLANVWSWTIAPSEVEERLSRIVTENQRTRTASASSGAEELDKRVERLFRAAESSNFEDGMESPFSRELLDVLKDGGTHARELVTYWIVLEKASAEVASEALRWIGAMDDPPSYVFRRWLLERCLASPSMAVRDGAAIGLAAMDDPHSVPFLSEAIAREQRAELRGDLEKVLAQLREE